ncbi:MAG: FdtA/QdtA family cupin domain-containing protein [Crocinitomicaceae bacterium]|nr:FdtA/QdtA family cupin domain-containing protein [Crocinitomicaceae bacterium]
MTQQPSEITFKSIGRPDIGYISVAEYQDLIPFEIKRVYWTYFTPNHIIRGNHAHKSLKQIIVAVSGIIEFELEDKKGNITSYTLDSPEKGIFVPEGYWRTIKFSHNAVLLCLASESYKEDDYIRDYDEFKRIK